MQVSNRALNLAANYAGIASTLLVNVVLVPAYVHHLGAESYGLIGFYTTLQAVLQVMDLGVGTTLNRELARRSALSHDRKQTIELIQTLELVSWTIGIVAGASVWLGSDILASDWLVPRDLSKEALKDALSLMGLALAVQWPINVYVGGLLGLQRQARAVGVTAASNIVFAAGAIFLLGLYPSVKTFFLWRAIVSLLTVLAQRTSLMALLPRGGVQGARPRLAALESVWRFSLGMAGVSITGVMLVQMDKLIVSRALTLDRFASYMVASSAAAVVSMLTAPIFTAMLPSLTQAAARSDGKELRNNFHLACQMVGAIVFPAAVGVAFFAEPLLILWTRNIALAQAAAPSLRILAIGSLINSTMVPFYSVQLAVGSTRIALLSNVALLLLIVPYGVYASSRWGATGAASTWAVLNTTYLLIGITITVRRILAGVVYSWLMFGVGIPLLCTLIVIGGLSRAVAVFEGLWFLFAVAATIVLAAAAVGLASPELRRAASEMLLRGRHQASTDG